MRDGPGPEGPARPSWRVVGGGQGGYTPPGGRSGPQRGPGRLLGEELALGTRAGDGYRHPRGTRGCRGRRIHPGYRGVTTATLREEGPLQGPDGYCWEEGTPSGGPDGYLAGRRSNPSFAGVVTTATFKGAPWLEHVSPL